MPLVSLSLAESKMVWTGEHGSWRTKARMEASVDAIVDERVGWVG